MGREVRRVPPGWKHPKDETGRFIPLLEDFKKDAEEWYEGNEQWLRGYLKNYETGKYSIPLNE